MNDLLDSEWDFMAFLTTRQPRKVLRERFVPSIRTSLNREYDNTTQKNLLFIRAQTKLSKERSEWTSTTNP